VIVTSAALSLAGTSALVLADHAVAPIYAGRFLTGLGSGAAFGAGTAWLRELSRPPFGATDHGAARRGAVTMTIGFAVGVFAAPAVAFALLPSVVGAAHATDGIALTEVVAMLAAMAGVLIQPLARRLDAHAAGNRAATVGLAVMVVGMACVRQRVEALDGTLGIDSPEGIGTTIQAVLPCES
jgi:MFS family permease